MLPSTSVTCATKHCSALAPLAKAVDGDTTSYWVSLALFASILQNYVEPRLGQSVLEVACVLYHLSCTPGHGCTSVMNREHHRDTAGGAQRTVRSCCADVIVCVPVSRSLPCIRQSQGLYATLCLSSALQRRCPSVVSQKLVPADLLKLPPT